MKVLFALVACLLVHTAFAQTQVPNDFVAGQPARASEVNENFDALEAAIDQTATAISQIPEGPQGPQGPPGADLSTEVSIVEGEQAVQNNRLDLLETAKVVGTCEVGNFVSEIAANGSIICGGTYGTQPNGSNTRFGKHALLNHQLNLTDLSGNRNSAFGTEALLGLVQGSGNTAVGFRALATGGKDFNTAVGEVALGALLAQGGSNNTAIGSAALASLSYGSSNTALGGHALWNLTTGERNTAIGATVMYELSEGNSNTGVGFRSLFLNTGNENIALGYESGRDLTTGDSNIVIGNPGIANDGFTTRIGSVQTRTFISGIRGTLTGNANAVSVVIDSNGQLGTISSSRLYKKDISDMGPTSEDIMRLRPVTFRYKGPSQVGDRPIEYGLIAEEVAEIFPELVVYNRDNQPETVKYRLLSSLLLNELQKQAGEVADLKAQVAELHELVGQMAKIDEPATDLVTTN